MVANWWLLHDPEVYSDPSSFEPRRFLAPRNEPNPSSVAFGFGSRTCSGWYLTKPGLFLTISRLLATFNIGKAVDADGNPIEPELK